MNLNQLTVFHEVMTTGSISQAARNLGRTQPAISLALKALEDTLGFQLFQRQGRALLPVPAPTMRSPIIMSKWHMCISA